MPRVLFWLLVVAGVSPLPAQGPVAHLQLPADFPDRLVTVVPARLAGQTTATALTGRDARLGGGDLVAQREAGTQRLWIALTRDAAHPASDALSIEIPLQPARLENRVTIAAAEHGFVFRDGEREVLFYRRDPKQQGEIRRAHYLHPLWSLDGQELTEEFPEDHLHHQGVFWAWHQLWVGDRPIGDPWVAKDFLVEVQEARVVEQGPLFATLWVRAHWTSPLVTGPRGEPQPIVDETTIIRVFRSQGDAQYVDLEIRLQTLLESVRLGGADNERGYSGFTVRVRPPRAIKIHDQEGLLAEDRIGGRSRWADVSGHFGPSDRLAGITILTHPALPEFPPRWLLRHYGMQNVLYPGREPVPLSATSPLVLQHRLVVHRHDHTAARVQDHQRVYEALEMFAND